MCSTERLKCEASAALRRQLWSKFMSWQVQSHAVLLSRATGKPVKVCMTKEEHLAAFNASARSAHERQGRHEKRRHRHSGLRPVAHRHGLLFDDHPVAGCRGCGEVQIMVRCANWNLKPTIVCTNRNASGIVRGFGGQELKCILIPLLSLAMENSHRALRLSQEKLREAGRRVLLAGRHLVHLSRGGLLGGHGQRGLSASAGKKVEGWLKPLFPERH